MKIVSPSVIQPHKGLLQWAHSDQVYVTKISQLSKKGKQHAQPLLGAEPGPRNIWEAVVCQPMPLSHRKPLHGASSPQYFSVWNQEGDTKSNGDTEFYVSDARSCLKASSAPTTPEDGQRCFCMLSYAPTQNKSGLCVSSRS